jgi:hypothetical protein
VDLFQLNPEATKRLSLLLLKTSKQHQQQLMMRALLRATSIDITENNRIHLLPQRKKPLFSSAREERKELKTGKNPLF